MDNLRRIELDGWTLRVRDPSGHGPHPSVLMLHGLSGDENAMWVFAHPLPAHVRVIALRGPLAAPDGGFGWVHQESGEWPDQDKFQYPVAALHKFVTAHLWQPDDPASSFHLVGFSQGAALSYVYGLTYSEQMASIAGLSGYLPDGYEARVQERPLTQLPVFVAHGTKDQLVAVARARHAVRTLQKAGAKVTYCEDEVGHKLSAGCLRGLGHFYQSIL